MSSCNICLEGFKRPVSLPCGHIFCAECIVQTIQCVKPVRNVHPCPLCRAPFNIVPLNPLVVPPHLRPFVTPTIRRVYIDSPETSGEPSSSSIPPKVAEDLAKLRTENATLRSHCLSWRRRAELHGAATLGLLDFARMVRDQAANIARERDEMKRECQSLKRKLDDYDQLSQTPFTLPPEYLTSTWPEQYSGPMGQQPYYIPPFHSSGSSCLASDAEASRLAVDALFDAQSYGKQQHPNPPSQVHTQNLDFGRCSRPPQNMPGPSRRLSAAPLATPSSSTLSLSPPSIATESSSSGNHSGAPTLDLPPRKRQRRDDASPVVEVDRSRRGRETLLSCTAQQVANSSQAPVQSDVYAVGQRCHAAGSSTSRFVV